VADVPASDRDGSLSEDLCFFKLAELVYLEKTEPISTLKHLSRRKYSFQKLTQFFQGINVLDAPASNIDDFLYADTCDSSTKLISPV
jgi:hypothetical protein